MNQYIISIFKRDIRKCFFIVFPLFLIWMASCDDMNSIHQKYYDWGEDIYTGAVDSVKAYGGYERVRFDWEINADPRIEKTIIYWNQRADSVIIEVNRTESGRLYVSHMLENMDEGSYIFEFITGDNKGHFSMPREVVVLIYGESYSQLLKNRRIVSIAKQLDGSMIIQWDPIASTEIQYTTVLYEVDGVERSIRVENDATETVLEGLNTNDVIRVSTTYLPEGALDELHAPYSEYIMPKFEREINKANFSIVILAGDNTSVSNGRDLSRIWDGGISNPEILHTVENAPGFNFPHHFTFDMGVLAEISRFRLWPRVDASPFSGHSPRYFEIWGSDELKGSLDDETYWKTDAWKADWKLLGDHEIIRPVSDESASWNAGWEYNVDDTIGSVRYIRLVIKNENWQRSNCVNIGEITLWGDDLLVF